MSKQSISRHILSFSSNATIDDEAIQRGESEDHVPMDMGFLPTFDHTKFEKVPESADGASPHHGPEWGDGSSISDRPSAMNDRPSAFKTAFLFGKGGSANHGDGERKSRTSFLSGMQQLTAAPNVIVKRDAFNINKDNTEERILKVLRKFDVDESGTLDMEEVTALVDHLLTEERNSRHLKWGIIGIVSFTVLLLACMTGLVYALLNALKDTEVKNSVFLVSKSGNILQVANSDFQVNKDGLLTNRYVGGNDSNPENPASDSGVLRVSTYAGVEGALHSGIPIKELMELNYLHLKSANGDEIAFRVNGVERKMYPQTQYGSVLFIYVNGGTIVLDGIQVSIQEEMNSIFQNAGFASTTSKLGDVAGKRRRLLDTTPTGRYNRLVEVNPLPEVNTENAQAWLIEASNAEEAADATAILAALREEQAAESEYAAMWNDYKLAFGKSYATMDDDLTAFRNWLKNMLIVLDVNLGNTTEWWTKPNQFSDMVWGEITQSVLTGMAPSREKIQAYVDANQPAGRRRNLLAEAKKIPDFVNWTAEGKVTDVLDQGVCGSCWTFGAAGALESAILIAYPEMDPKTVSISTENFVACVHEGTDPEFMSMGCWGGDPIEPLLYAAHPKFFAVSEEIYPYTLQKTDNTPFCDEVVLATASKADKAHNTAQPEYVFPFDNEQAMLAAVARQPVVAYFEVDLKFMDYAGGVYHPSGCGEATNHNFLITGYNLKPDKGETPYWMIKNQWGKGWGENGFGKIAMTGDGPGPCGLYTVAVYPSLEFDSIIGTPMKKNGKASSDGSDDGDSGDSQNADEPSDPIDSYDSYDAGGGGGGGGKRKAGKKAARRRS